MNITQLQQQFSNAGRESLLVSSGNLAAVIAPDLEGRIYCALDGEIVSRVNLNAVRGHSGPAGYINPGGDGLWPAPEGTCFGYEYATGSWRVPPGLVNSRWEVISHNHNFIEIASEIDLVNSRQEAIPCVFRRSVTFEGNAFRQLDTIEYIGNRVFKEGEFLLAPWSLSQFDSSDLSYALLPANTEIRDLYADTTALRASENGCLRVNASKDFRWQIAVGSETPVISLVLPRAGIKITRSTAELPNGQRFIDIADAAPDTKPADKGVRYSVYNDPSGFMEIESVGGCTVELTRGTLLTLDTTTYIEKI